MSNEERQEKNFSPQNGNVAELNGGSPSLEEQVTDQDDDLFDVFEE